MAQRERENRHGERARDTERYIGKDIDSYRHRERETQTHIRHTQKYPLRPTEIHKGT